MNNLFIPKALLLLLTVVLTSCSSISNPVNSNLASLEEDSGFGGTGIIRYAPEGDEGGSGFGGTGIIGNIDAFGSIWVNSIEIDYAQDVVIQSNLKGGEQKLKLGQSVILQTNPTLNEQDRPSTELISIYYPFAGAIQKIEQDRLLVNEHWIELTRKTRRDENLTIAIGQYLAVNANRNRNQQWVASRLNHNPLKEVINQPSVEIRFSADINGILLDERLEYLQSNWTLKHDFMPTMKRSRIPRNVWDSRIRHERHPLFRQPATEGMRHNGLQQFRDINDTRQTLKNLPPPQIRREFFIPNRHP